MNEILIAVIGVVGALLAALIGLFAQRPWQSQQRQLYGKLLKKVYQPLHLAVFHSDNQQLYQQLNTLHKYHAPLLPPKLENRLKKLLLYFPDGRLTEEPLTADQALLFNELSACIEADYNSLRKSLGFATDPSKIIHRYLSYGHIKNTLYIFITIIPLALFYALGVAGFAVYLGASSTLIGILFYLSFLSLIVLLWFAETGFFKLKPGKKTTAGR